jgi:hypothetical protein
MQNAHLFAKVRHLFSGTFDDAIHLDFSTSGSNTR